MRLWGDIYRVEMDGWDLDLGGGVNVERWIGGEGGKWERRVPAW